MTVSIGDHRGTALDTEAVCGVVLLNVLACAGSPSTELHINSNCRFLQQDATPRVARVWVYVVCKVSAVRAWTRVRQSPPPTCR